MIEISKDAKGLIALDIDGTITTDMQAIPKNVVSYLYELHKQGWRFVFITGRTFDFGDRVLNVLPFGYYYAVQNGAILFSMPRKEILAKKYLDKSIVPLMDKICKEEPTDFVIYAGFEWDNQCFFRKSHFSPQLLNYLEERQKAFHENWTDIPSFSELPIDEFPSIKCFGRQDSAQNIADQIETHLNLHVPVIKDPFCHDYYVVQATHPDVNKGKTLRHIIERTQPKMVIAAGDDLNDLSMFSEAHIAVAMENAPNELKSKAHIIAPPASLSGIVEGLQQALAYGK